MKKNKLSSVDFHVSLFRVMIVCTSYKNNNVLHKIFHTALKDTQLGTIEMVIVLIL